MSGCGAIGDHVETLARIERTVERLTGTKASELRRMSFEENRRVVEAKHGGERMRFSMRFPAIGRGNVLRERTRSRVEINRMVDETL